MTSALRMALIWRDEVMDDLVVQDPRKLTLGSRCVRQVPWLAIAIALGFIAVTAATLWLQLLPFWIALLWQPVVCLGLIVHAWWKWQSSGRPTFIVPSLGLPELFAIIRPGNQGYLLTLGDRMRGRICLSGEEKDVAEFVRRNDSGGGFRATPIGGRDWGVIDLDESGHYKVFFQFVQADEPPQFVTRPVLFAGAGGYLISCMTLTLLWYSKGFTVGEAVFRGAGIATAALLIGGIGWGMIHQDGESQASLAFSVILHAALLFMAFTLYQDEDPFVWPGPRSLTGNYLVTRIEKEEPPEVKQAPTISGKPQQAEAAATKEPPKNTATKGDEGRHGGAGDTERARDPNAKDVPPAPPKVQFFEDKNKKILDNIVDRNLATSLGKFSGIKGDTLTKGSIGFGLGKGSGVGTGTGTGTRSDSKKGGSGGGGNVEGDFVSGGKIDTGTNRPGGGNCKGPGCGTGPKPIQVAFAAPSGDFDQLTAEEIDRVVRARAGVFRACYQKELNHTPGIGGKLVIHFKIGGDGVVQSGNTQTSSGSSLRNDAVEQCVKSNVNRLKFPAKGGIANVNYPFVFSQGG